MLVNVRLFFQTKTLTTCLLGIANPTSPLPVRIRDDPVELGTHGFTVWMAIDREGVRTLTRLIPRTLDEPAAEKTVRMINAEI